jgi:hypothetical protein
METRTQADDGACEEGGRRLKEGANPVRGERGRRVADLRSVGKVNASSNLLNG